MRSLLLAFISVPLLAGCAGYAMDYTRPKTSIIAPQLPRYGLNATQSQCMGDRLAASLTVWQLRQLERAAKAVANANPNSPLSSAELIRVSAQIEDRQVEPLVSQAVQACGIIVAGLRELDVRRPEATPSPDVGAAPDPISAARTRAPTWLNLGAAPTGQSIAVEALSIDVDGTRREAWFRLTNPGESGPSNAAYLLRIDCAARTINSMAFRRHGPSGAVTESRTHGPNGEGAAPIEPGTVMEIAYLALCT